MITSNLKGGMGNQLFQIAAACGLAFDNNDTFGFNFDNCYTPLQGFKSSKYKNSIYKNIPTIDNLPNNIYNEPSFEYKKIPYCGDVMLDGYFQSEKYFGDYKEKVVNLFDLTYRSSEIDEFINKLPRPITSIHIRRGDYLPLTDIFVILDKEYYLSAMSVLEKSTSFLIFSDDIDWAKQNFDGRNIYFSESHDELFDFISMSKCDNNIIANSSFSWWASYLNKNKNKTVIGPKKWFNPSSNLNFKDILPEEWIRC